MYNKGVYKISHLKTTKFIAIFIIINYPFRPLKILQSKQINCQYYSSSTKDGQSKEFNKIYSKIYSKNTLTYEQ